MPEISLSETRHQRARRDMRGAQTQGYWYGFLALNLVLSITSAIAAAVSPPDPSVLARIIIGVVAALVAFVIGALLLIALTYAWFWWKAPLRQRDEARRRVGELELELREHKLFDVVCPTTFLGLPINRLADGTYRGSVIGLGISPILVAHRGDLTIVTRLTARPEVRFIDPDNAGWHTSGAIMLGSQPNPFASPGAMDFAWDTTNPGQWVLMGLPLSMGKDEILSLPFIMVTVANANEVGTHFASGGKCKLVIPLAIRTDKGSPTLPDQSIELTISDIRN